MWTVDLQDTGNWLADGKLVVRKTQDVEPILEHNKRLYTDGDGYSKSRELRRAASIPNVVVEEWRREGFDIFDPNCKADLLRRLDDPDYRDFRTAPGRLYNARKMPGRPTNVLDSKGKPFRMVTVK